MAVMVTSGSVGFGSVILVRRLLARMSRPMWRRISVHSSCCSAKMAPRRRTSALRSGKTSDDVSLSSGLGFRRRECFVLVVGHVLLKAVEEDAHETVREVAQCGGVTVAALTAPVVVGSGAR